MNMIDVNILKGDPECKIFIRKKIVTLTVLIPQDTLYKANELSA